MPKTGLATLIVLAALSLGSASASAQVVQPLGPPSERGEPAPGEPETAEGGVIPIPLGGRSAEAARSGTRVGSVLPPAWSSLAFRYQPLWDVAGAGSGFGLERWGPYFAASALMPQLAPHPFLSPFGMLSYEGWLFDRYRAAWDGAFANDDRLDGAAGWLQRGDRAMAEGRADDATLAYRRVTQSVPELPLGWLALGAALAEAGDDAGAAGAFRQGFDRYPAWLAPALDWQALYGGADRLVAVQSAAAERAEAEPGVNNTDARFVAGVLHLFGGAPATGRRLLTALPGDPHAAALLARGPR